MTFSALNGETITSAQTGFKLKVLAKARVGSATNSLTNVAIPTVSSSVAQAYQYPLDLATIELTNMIPGSRYEIYNQTTSTTITNAIATTSSASISASASNGNTLRIRVRKSIATPQESTYTWSAGVITITYVGHGRYVGETVNLAFSSGDAVGSDGTYTITTTPLSSTYTVDLAGSGTGGNVTSTPVKYLPFETGATIASLASSSYISQLEDTIAS
jgi:hypothetical protein